MEGIPNKEQLIAELKQLLRAAHRKDRLGTHDKIVEKDQALKNKYCTAEDNSQDYEMWHVLVGSTLREPAKKFDFPGDDSVEKFIRSL